MLLATRDWCSVIKGYNPRMFRFFSKIRNEILTDKKTNRYFLYAAGEFLLVIVGILIALRIDTWQT